MTTLLLGHTVCGPDFVSIHSVAYSRKLDTILELSLCFSLSLMIHRRGIVISVAYHVLVRSLLSVGTYCPSDEARSS